MQQLLASQALGDAVVEKRVDHRLHMEVEHAVGQRRAHVVADRAVEAGVAGGHHLPAGGAAHPGLALAAQLGVAGAVEQRHRRGQQDQSRKEFLHKNQAMS